MKTRAKWIIGAAVALGFLVTILVVIPFLIDFSQFKPEIQAAASEHLNAKIDFSSARLQLIPRIGIRLSKVSVENTDPLFSGTKLFAVDSLLIDANLLPLFSGRLEGQILIKAPEITIACLGLKNNMTALSKSQATAQSATTSESATPKNTTKSSQAKPAPAIPADAKSQAATMKTIKDRVLIESISIEGANITIREIGTGQAQTKEPLKVRELNIHVTNLGLARDIKLEVDTRVEVNDSGLQIQGPIRMNNVVNVAMGGMGLESASFSGQLSYDELAINFRDAFVKAKGIPLNVSFSGKMVPEDFVLNQLKLQFHNLKMDAAAHIVDFKDPRFSAAVKIADENLASMGDVLPKHRDMLINGQMHLDGGVEGKISALDTLAARLTFDTKLAGTDLAVKLGTTGIVPFKGKLEVNSRRIDLDGLLKPFAKPAAEAAGHVSSPDKGGAPTPPAANTAESKPAAGQPAAPAPASSASKDFELTAEQKKSLMGTDANIHVSMAEIIYSGQKLTDLKVNLIQKNLLATLDPFSIDGFGGKISAKGHVNLGESPIVFDGDFAMNDVHPELVMAVVKPEHKDVIVGRMNLNITAKGKGSTLPTLNKTLNGGGNFKFLDGELNTPSIAQKMQEEFAHYIDSLAPPGSLAGNPKVKDAVKDLGSAKITSKASTHRSIKDLAGKVDIKDGKIFILCLNTDQSGTTDVRSNVDLEMNLGGGAVYTASDATKKELLAKTKYADLLFNDKGSLVIPMNFSGTVMDPKVSIVVDQMRETFQKKAIALIGKEVQKAAQDFVKGIMGGDKAKDGDAKAKKDDAETKAKEALKGLFGK